MKKFLTSFCLGACSLTLLAGTAQPAPTIADTSVYARPELKLYKNTILTNQAQEKSFRLEQANELKEYSFTLAPSNGVRKAPRKVTAAEITGVSYVVKYFDGDIDCNTDATIAFSNDSIVFVGLANGRNVKGVFDATTGTAQIPVGQSLGTHSTYGAITLGTLNAAGKLVMSDTVITATFTENGFKLDNSLIGQVSAGSLIVMNNVNASKANGTITFTQGTNNFAQSVIVKKQNNAEISVVGISSLLYGAYIPVTFTINQNDSTLTLPFGTQVDNQWTQTGYVPWTLGGINANGKLDDLNLKVEVKNGISTATAGDAFYGYEKTAGTGSYSGYQFTNPTLEVDFDILAEIPEPCPILGKEYVVLFNDNYDDLNSSLTISEGENGMVVLEGLANGYDVTGSYDSKTNTIVIPTGVVIGTNSTYGDITLYALKGNTLSEDPITVSIADGKLTFDKGIGGQVTAGTLIVMNSTEAVEANGAINFVQGTNKFRTPVILDKVSDTKVKVVGISSLLYGAYIEVPFTLDATAKTLSIPFPTQVDNQYTSTGYIPWFLGGVADNGVTDLTLNISTTDNSSTMTAAGMWYVRANGTSYNGYKFTNVVLDANFNILTAAASGEPITDTPQIDDIFYKIDFDTKLATVTGCAASLKALNVPATFEYNNATYTVTAVAQAAFQNNSTLTSLSLPATIDSVATDAFRNMKVLTSVDITDLKAWCAIKFGNGLANPIYNVFPTTQSKWGTVKVNGQAVTTLTIPEGVTELGRSFYGFKSLTAVTLPSTLTTVGDQCFSNCVNLAEIVIPEGVKTIGSAFFGCSGLTKATLPSTLTALTNSTFYGCSALESIELPASLESIGLMAFCGCKGLKSITSHATVPPTAKTMAFDGVDTTIPVNVPAASVEAYKAADEWKDFTNFVALGSSAVEEIESASEEAVYFDLNGRRVNGTLNPGIYVRIQGKESKKVIVK